MNSKRDNTKILIYDKADEVIEELFKSLLNRHQIKLETSIKESNFVFIYFYLSKTLFTVE